MGTPAVLLLGVFLLGIAAAFLAASLRPRGLVAFLLAGSAIGWALLVAIVLSLSPLALVTRGWLLAALAVAAAGSVAFWRVRGRPPFPSVREATATAAATIRGDAALVVLSALVLTGAAYTVALAFATPPLDFDALLYHLPRAALWRQEHAVGYVAGASDPRLDGNPPGAEIGVLLTMVLSGGDRFVALPQTLALAVCCLATLGIGRRVGLSRDHALFGALLVATLPVLVVQATTAYNDLVVAAFLATAAYAMLGRTRGDLVVLALSVGLALTTKPLAVLALPLLALVALVSVPRSQWRRLLAAGACGVVLGAPWYLLNLAETGKLDGGLAADADQRQTLAVLEISTTLRRHLYSLLDFSGARALDLTALFATAAIAVLALGVATAIATRRPRIAVAAFGAALVVALPRILLAVQDVGMHLWVKVWVVLGRRDIADADASWQPQTGADAGLSWYGPLGTIMVASALALTVTALRRRQAGWTPVVLAGAPLLFIGLFAVTLSWDPWRGRLLAFSFLLSAATWGLVLAHRWLAWGAVALTALMLPLVLLDSFGRPVGLAWLDQDRSVWTSSRASLLAWRMEEGSGAVQTSRVVRRIPAGATVAIAPLPGDVLYPLLEPVGKRTTLLVPVDGGRVPRQATWLVVAPGARVARCGTWVRIAEPAGWAVERRTSHAGACHMLEVETS